MNMLFFGRVVFTLLILGAGYFALTRVWTRKVDLLGLLKAPSNSIPVAEEGISVTPAILDLSTADWDKTEIVEIKNGNPTQTVYSLWIKFWAESGEFNPKELKFTPADEGHFLEEKIGDVSTDFRVVRFGGLDSVKRPCVYFLIYRLAALESWMVKVKRTASGHGEKKPLVLRVEGRGFSSKPTPIVSQTDKVGVQFKPPESMTITEMGLLMRRTP
jgi:hypothetical protein